jgi:hypothetical protein
VRAFKLFRGVAATLTLALMGAMAHSASTPQTVEEINRAAAGIAQELAVLCPAADPADQAAFDRCRRGLYGDSQVRRRLPDYVLWGRQRDPKTRLKDVRLTQFAPDVLTAMYLPLFMFNGKYTVQWVDTEGLYLIRLQSAFRSRLAPGQFPYPFWHEADKWSMYQNANEVLLWWDPTKARVPVAQFTALGANPPIVAAQVVAAPPFDGRWTWTDASGKSQPVVTMFDGILSPSNPYLAQVDGAYKRFALRMRDGQCNNCHVPNNPDGMKKLVLLQSPAHAAGEIRRVLDSVQRDRMPRNEFGIEEPLDARTKAALLDEGRRFAEILEAAKQWEARSAQAAAASDSTAMSSR